MPVRRSVCGIHSGKILCPDDAGKHPQWQTDGRVRRRLSFFYVFGHRQQQPQSLLHWLFDGYHGGIGHTLYPAIQWNYGGDLSVFLCQIQPSLVLISHHLDAWCTGNQQHRDRVRSRFHSWKRTSLSRNLFPFAISVACRTACHHHHDRYITRHFGGRLHRVFPHPIL